MTTNPDPVEVARRLSDGQKRALCGIPIQRDFRPSLTGFQWKTLACLKAKRLINSIRDGDAGWGPLAMHRITPRGLAVRAQLTKGQDDAE